MAELESAPGGGRLQALDAAASDSRSVTRRAGRLSERLAELGDSELIELGAEQLQASERLLAALEEGRARERVHMRRLLRGFPDEESA